MDTVLRAPNALLVRQRNVSGRFGSHGPNPLTGTLSSGVLRQPGEQVDGAIGQPSGDLARSGKHDVPRSCQRGHPPLHRL